MTALANRNVQRLSIPFANNRRGFWNALAGAMAVARQRRALDNLDDYRLNDIGVSRCAARIEAHRPIWHVPLQRRK
ncbi:DUF1127 domain-containing protein [Yoonia sp.]|uniref:DUF1127 domain-containing protein n=1 Tax=Yoonia sp. TaxID=2212373 RepID=UPI0025D031DF|nr:DUF1127 domain-containing protein [Yoonia sp.]